MHAKSDSTCQKYASEAYSVYMMQWVCIYMTASGLMSSLEHSHGLLGTFVDGQGSKYDNPGHML